MNKKFIPFFKDPKTKEPLQFFPFEINIENVKTGLFLNEVSGNIYPVIEGVPVMLPDSVSKEFHKNYEDQFAEFRKRFPSAKINISDKKNSWSFSLEWESHFDKDMETTWGMTVPERYEQFLIENQVKESDVTGKKIMDAGCGNGMLTEYISQKKDCSVFGLDFSESVFKAEHNRKSDNVCFVQGDLQNLPFSDDFFDIIFSNGVLHHTPDTYTTFKSVAKSVKPGGSFYLWLYCRKGSIPWRLKRRWFDFLRAIISRTPPFFQKFAVNIHTGISYTLQFITGKKVKRSFNEIRIDMFDSITPRWRYYHEPLEVSKWFYDCGFDAGTVTHWDNPFGFGMVSFKNKVEKTPGVNFH
jgi:SAM-dependent methyltransferase